MYFHMGVYVYVCIYAYQPLWQFEFRQQFWTCIYVCRFVCVCAYLRFSCAPLGCMHAYIYLHCICMCACRYGCMHAYIHITRYMYVTVYGCMSAYLRFGCAPLGCHTSSQGMHLGHWGCMYVCACVSIYMYVCIYIHI